MESWTLIRCLWERGQYNANIWLDGVFAYQCNSILSLLLLGTSKTPELSQANKVQHMIKRIQGIMRRLIQTSQDFSEIVISNSFGVVLQEHINNPETYADTISSQSQSCNNPNEFAGMFSSVPQIQSSDPFFIDWGSNLNTEVIQGDFTNDSSIFDPLFGLSFEDMNFQTN
jgi:hypothetical protein